MATWSIFLLRGTQSFVQRGLVRFTRGVLVAPSSTIATCITGSRPIMSLLSSRAQFQELRDRLDQPHNTSGSVKQTLAEFTRCACKILPSVLLLLVYDLAVAEESILRDLLRPAVLVHYIPMVPFVILLVSSRDFHIRTAKFLDILGNPPVRRWEFDMALLDTLVPDQTDVWVIWKKRVADRITHEVEISFAPTLPSFGGQRQKHLKDLLDQAQLGYGVYRRFYDWHVPLYSTALSTVTS